MEVTLKQNSTVASVPVNRNEGAYDAGSDYGSQARLWEVPPVLISARYAGDSRHPCIQDSIVP